MKEIGNAWNLQMFARAKIAILAIAFFFLVFQPTPGFAKFSPEIYWETVETLHFRVHFPAGAQAFANELGRYLEEAYPILSRDLHWELSSKADIVVNTDTDSANGSTSVFPLNRIVMNAVAFSPVSSIGEFDNWIRMLAYHELTHLIANDTTRGFFAAGRDLVGSAAKVNPYQPLWIVEGLAVYEETLHSAYGRGRSAWVDALLRSSVMDGFLGEGRDLLGVTLDRLNDGPPIWPSGTTPYVYGYVMQEMLAESGGKGAPGEASLLSGGTVPFLIDRVARESAGKSFSQLWDQAVARLREIAAKELAEIRQAPVMPPAFLTHTGRQSGAAAFTEPRVFYYVRDSYSRGTGLSRVDLRAGREEKVSDWFYGGAGSLRAKGPLLLYSRNQLVNEFSLYLDAYLFDSRSGREYRLTEGLRASDPEFSPDFEWRDGRIARGAIAYSKNLIDGNQAIALWDGQRERVLWAGRGFERLSSPAWAGSPDPDWIVFSERRNGIGERLMAVNARTGMSRVITPLQGLRAGQVTPVFSGNGDLWFSDSTGGVYDLYRLPAAKVFGPEAEVDSPKGIANLERMTRLETAAFSPVLAGGRLYATVLHGSGYDIAELPFASPLQASAPLAPLKAELRSAPELSPTPAPQEPAPALVPKSYSPFPALWPKYVLPYAQIVPDGFLVGLETSGYDAAQLNDYSLSIGYDSRANFPIYAAVYQYDGFYPSVRLERQQFNNYDGLLGLSNAVSVTDGKLIYNFGLTSMDFGAIYQNSQFSGAGNSVGGVQVDYAFSNAEIYPNAIDPAGGDNGTAFSLGATGFLFGGPGFTSFTGRFEQRVPVFFNEHFLRFYASGAHSNNADFGSNYFVGGGESNIAYRQDYLVRGYEPGALLGRDIAAFSLEYWMPVLDLFRGLGTLPAYYQRAKFRFFADTGSAEFVAFRGGSFTYWPVGAGAQLLQDINLFYRVPVTLAVGFDKGLNPSLGGENQVVAGIFGQF